MGLEHGRRVPDQAAGRLRHKDGQGGVFDSVAAEAYAASRHGVDGRLLDPYIALILQRYAPGATFIDVGTGAGAVAIDAVRGGAGRVLGLDNSRPMLDQAISATRKAEATDTIPRGAIHFVQGSAEALPFPEFVGDVTLSVNVGCAVPTGEIFGPHFSEMARVTRPDGLILVTAPTTFGEVFTSGTETKTSVLETIATALSEVNAQPHSDDEITHIQALRRRMSLLGEVNRATFVRRDNRFLLVYNGSDFPEILTSSGLVIPESELINGEPIERKLAGSEKTTGLVVPNYYHPRSEYLAAIRDAGLKITGGEPMHKIMTRKELDTYNSTLHPDRQLGSEYLNHSPFDIYILTK